MIYLDYAATTPLDPEVKARMLEALEVWGNPSSVHAVGRKAKALLEEARERLAAALGAHPRELVFTSGGTEADALALMGTMLARGRGHLVVTAVEHSAVLGAAHWLEQRGFAVTRLEPDRYGLIHPEQVAEALRGDTVLVSVMTLNNELGTLYPVREIAALCRERGVVFHTDAVQAFGTIPFRVDEVGADLVSISAHKFYGPKGAGALYVRRGLELTPLIPGKQEKGWRGGTENLAGVVGMAYAAEQAVARLPEEQPRMTALRERLERGLLAVEGVELNGHPTQRGPKHVNVTVLEADGEGLLLNLDLLGVAASSGSACSAGSLEPSHVLMAIGRTRAEARASVRFSVGRYTTEAEVDRAVACFREAVARARALV